MSRKSMLCALSALVAGLIVCAMPASASLSVFKTYTGDVAATQDGCGSVTQACTITLNVPTGSTVINAYLYTGMFGASSGTPPGGTLDAQTVTYGPNVDNATACCALASARADVTSIVAPIVNGGLGTYTFNVTETFSGQDGEGLVIVYSNPTIATSTVGILDGFASVTGDTTSINFATPLDPTAAGFRATMGLGDNFSCCSQASTVSVDGQTLTTVAGNNDDSQDGGSAQNGNLITVGGPNDGFTPATPGFPQTDYTKDHEYYDLAPFITKGDTSITVDTANASHDDNIFLATFDVSGLGGVNKPPPTDGPEPSALGMLGLGVVGLLAMRRYQGAKLGA